MAVQPRARQSLTISGVSRLLDVPVPTIRSWERRYRFLQPSRSAGGHRRYTMSDVRMIRAVRDEIIRGRPAREAVVAIEARSRPADGERFVEAVLRAGRAFDAFALRRVLDSAAEEIGPENTLQFVALAALREIGDQWKAGVCGVDDEHFLTHEIRMWFFRLVALAPDPWRSCRLVLACGPDETHSAGLDAFSVVLARRGWRCVNLGARTPAASVAAAARTPEVCGVIVTCQRSVTRPATVNALRAASRVRGVTVFYAGHGFSAPRSRSRLPGRYLGDHLVGAAEIVEAELSGN